MSFTFILEESERRPRRFSDLVLPVAKPGAGPYQPESPGSVLSPTSQTSAAKPPIFPSPETKASNGFKFTGKQKPPEFPSFVRDRLLFIDDQLCKQLESIMDRYCAIVV